MNSFPAVSFILPSRPFYFIASILILRVFSMPSCLSVISLPYTYMFWSGSCMPSSHRRTILVGRCPLAALISRWRKLIRQRNALTAVCGRQSSVCCDVKPLIIDWPELRLHFPIPHNLRTGPQYCDARAEFKQIRTPDARRPLLCL